MSKQAEPISSSEDNPTEATQSVDVSTMSDQEIDALLNNSSMDDNMDDTMDVTLEENTEGEEVNQEDNSNAEENTPQGEELAQNQENASQEANDPNNEESPLEGENPYREDTNTVDQEASQEDQEAKKKELEANDPTFHEIITTPYKIKGKNVSIDNIEEARNLISKGLAFEQNQKKLKNYLPIMKALSENGVSDPNSIARLIDIQKGDKEAIKDLIKEHDIDIFDEEFSDDEGVVGNYSPKTQIRSADSIAINDKIGEYDDQPIQKELVNILNNDFKDDLIVFANEPEFIDGLAEQVVNGTFDKVMNKMRSMSRVGKFPSGLTTMQKYNSIYAQMVDDNDLTNDSVKPDKGNLSESSKAKNNQGKPNQKFDPKVRKNLSEKIGKPQQKSQTRSRANITKLNNVGSNDLQDLLDNMN